MKRAAVMSQAIVVRPDDPANIPQQVANRVIGVNFHSGSHYTALRLLEGYLRRDEIQLIHLEGRNRLEALLDGEIEAVALMEPYISMAEKLGCKVLAEGHYAGTEIAGEGVDDEVYEALMRAMRRAVDRINADKRKYVHYMIEDMPERFRSQMIPDDFHLPRLRYDYPEPYSAEEFQRTAEWMVSWGLIEDDADYERLVENKITVETR